MAVTDVMIETNQPTHSSPAITDDFLAVVCADEQLLHAEFDAIIAEEWPSGPPTWPGHQAGGYPQKPADPRRPAPAWFPSRPDQPRLGDWVRERSPPEARAQFINSRGR